MHVHRHRGGLSEVRAAEAQSTICIKGRRDLPRKPRSPADGRDGLPGRGVQSVRPGPGRPNGPLALLVKILSPLPVKERIKVRVLVPAHCAIQDSASDLYEQEDKGKGPFNRCSLTPSSSDAACNGPSSPTRAASPAQPIPPIARSRTSSPKSPGWLPRTSSVSSIAPSPRSIPAKFTLK